jgi:anti-sigma factor RsiW
MKDHSIVRDLLALASAGALSPSERQEVEEHLRHCEMCRAELNDWSRLVGALREIPTPQARPKMVLQTRRILEIYAAQGKGFYRSRLVPIVLVLFSWITMIMTWQVVHFLNVPLARWLDISSTTVWIAFIGITWPASALAACLLVKNSRQEGKTI